MSDSGRGYDPTPDFVTNAFNVLKGFGQGVQDALGAASQAPVVGGALQAIGTVGNIATVPFGLPSLLSGDPVAQRAALEAYRTEGGDVPGLFDIAAVARSVQAGREAQAGEFAQIAENQGEGVLNRTLAAAAQFATGALPNVAPVPFVPGGARTIASGGVDALRALRTPKGLIATRAEELAGHGLTPEQSFAALQHEFGETATQRWATTGDDVFHEAAPGSAPIAAPTGALAPKQIGEAPEVIPGGVTIERPTFTGTETEFIPTARGPKMGTGTPRENLGVNLDKIDAPPATKDYIRQVAEQNAGFEAQRRGVITIAETQAAADKIAVDAEQFAYLKPGTALNAEQLKAVRDAMVTKGRDITALQEAVRAEQAAGVVSKETTLRLLAAATEHQTLQRVYAGARAESGRALRIQREISDGLGRGDINGTYQRATDMLGGKDNANLLIQKLQDIWTDPKLTPREREVATYRFVRNIDRATTADKVQEFWTNAILSSPVTHAVNITGQTLLHLADIGTNFLAALADIPVAALERRPRDITFSRAFGAVASTGDGFRRGLRNLKDAEELAATKFRETGSLSRGQAIGSGFNVSRAERAFGAVVNVPTKVLGAEDAVFRGLGEARGLYESAYQTAAREGLRPFSGAFVKRVAELLDDPTDAMIAYAKEVSARSALRMEPGQATQVFLRLRDVVDVGGVKPLRYVVPFVTTPINILKIGGEYSPLGFVQAIRKTGGERSLAIARAGLGSAAMAYFAQQYALGNVTGPAPRDPAAKDAFYASGKIPFAVKLGDQWVSFSRLEPVATPLKWVTAAMQTAQDEPNGFSWDATAPKMAFAVARLMEDSTYLSGLSDLVDAMQDPRKATDAVQRIVGGFNPALVRTLVQSNDPYIRDPKGIWQQIESTLPYLNEQVPVRQTALGEPATRTEGKQGIAGVVSPMDFSREEADPITAKVMSYRLPESIGSDGQPLPARALNVGFVSQEIASLRLTPDEGRRYQTLAGQATRNLLEKLFADELPYDSSTTGEPTAFSKLIYEDQIRAIRKTITDARETGRAQAADEFMAGATNDGQVARAALMRISTIGKMRDRARYLEGLQRQGRLSAEVRRGIDERRGKGDPTVSEYVQAAPVIDEYVNEPPYLIGTPEEWAQLRLDRAAAQKYADATNKPPTVPMWQWYAQVNPEGALRIRVYDRQQLRNPQRTALLRQYPWLERFVSGSS